MAKRVAYYGIFSALAILMGYVERLIPISIAVPGIKLGLANVVILIVIYFMGNKEGLWISFVRIIMSGLLFSGFAGFLYSLAGALLSYIIMVLLKKFDSISIMGVSVAGGIAHNIGQIIVACLVVQNWKLIYYLPILLISGIATGILVGITAKYALNYLNKANIKL